MREGISIFRGDVPHAGEFDAVASRIGLGSQENDDMALASLQSLAQVVGEAEGWNRYALVSVRRLLDSLESL
jgi:hypothetical protein